MQELESSLNLNLDLNLLQNLRLIYVSTTRS
jgi:hypothetical protein